MSDQEILNSDWFSFPIKQLKKELLITVDLNQKLSKKDYRFKDTVLPNFNASGNIARAIEMKTKSYVQLKMFG